LDNVMQRTTATRVVIIACAAALALVLLATVHSTGAGAAPETRTQTTRRRASTTTTTTTTTAPTSTDAPFVTPVAPGATAPNGGPLLVPGASDAPGSTAADVKNDDNTGTIVALVIAGLLVVALLLALLTYWFWRSTRPRRAPVELGSDEPAKAKVNDG
jgi:cobalamin biosynthesis Mg chelatase CobN